jgi:hypothetical protein
VQRERESNNGWLFSTLPFKKRLLELEAENTQLHELNAALSKEVAETKSEANASRIERMNVEARNIYFKHKVSALESENAELRAALDVKQSDDRGSRPEWAKRLNVEDLFNGAKTDDAVARRFRELSKIYHPDRVNNPDGFDNLIQHLQTANPNWLRAACYEAFLLIKDKTFA